MRDALFASLKFIGRVLPVSGRWPVATRYHETTRHRINQYHGTPDGNQEILEAWKVATQNNKEWRIAGIIQAAHKGRDASNHWSGSCGRWLVMNTSPSSEIP